MSLCGHLLNRQGIAVHSLQKVCICPVISTKFPFPQHQWNTQGGKCGICGDAYDEPQPRTHEIGGPYYQGIIVQKYTAGQVMCP